MNSGISMFAMPTMPAGKIFDGSLMQPVPFTHLHPPLLVIAFSHWSTEVKESQVTAWTDGSTVASRTSPHKNKTAFLLMF